MGLGQESEVSPDLEPRSWDTSEAGTNAQTRKQVQGVSQKLVLKRQAQEGSQESGAKDKPDLVAQVGINGNRKLLILLPLQKY